MDRKKQLVSLMLAVAMAVSTFGVTATVSAQQRAYRVTEREVAALLGRIESQTAQFRRDLEVALNQSRLDQTRREDNINEFVRNFETSVFTLRDRFRAQRDVAADVREVLSRAAYIDNFMRRHRLGVNAERSWASLRTDLDRLADYYNVSWRWETVPGRGPGFNRITGTYRLDPTRSDNVWRTVRRATRGFTEEEKERLRQRLARRLEAPEMLAIQRRGREITLASTSAPQVTFEADGRERVEETGRGRTVRVRATLNGDQLVISQTGARGSDYRATFDPLPGGRQLRVTRSIDIERIAQPVVVNSYYNQTSEIAELDLYRGTPPGGSPSDDRGRGPWVIRNGEQLVAVLSNTLSTRQAREGDRFTMVVRSPSMYDGAVIEGYVSRVDPSGRLTGRPEIAMNFERIRMRDGRSYSFEGYIETVRAVGGDDVRVDAEGRVSETDSQTQETITRTGIGAALGALLGAIAGGGKGAAIGAAIGGGAGAGSVYVQGRDHLELVAGTEFTIRAVAPRDRIEPGR